MSLDVFNNQVFGTRNITDAINIVPRKQTLLGDMGLFTSTSIATTKIEIEYDNGSLSLVKSTPRGSDGIQNTTNKRNVRDFRVPRFLIEDRFIADDVQNLRSFGTNDQLEAVETLVNQKLTEMSNKLDITEEWLRVGAVKGNILDADGTVLYNMFTEFGITQETFGGFGTTDVNAFNTILRDISRYYEENLNGETMTMPLILHSRGTWEAMMAHDDVRDSYRHYKATQDPNQNDYRNKGFIHQDVRHIEYLGTASYKNDDGTSTVNKFVPDNECIILPLGTQQLFRTYYAPADYRETVNTMGQARYAKTAPDPKFNRYVDIEAQTNTISIPTRPSLLCRGTVAA